MKKILFILTSILILKNCGGFDFVYQTNRIDFFIVNNTDINVDGDDVEQIYIALRNVIGDKEEDNPQYRLLVNSKNLESALVTNKDATASKFKIEYLINYDLYNQFKDCKILNKEILTVSVYNAKAAGYSYGTDMSQHESSVQNINNNINEFISSLNQLSSTNSCDG